MDASTNEGNVISVVCKGKTLDEIMIEDKRECFILVMPDNCEYDMVKIPKYITENLAKVLPAMVRYYKQKGD